MTTDVMATLIVTRVDRKFQIQSIDNRTKARQSSRALTEDELRAKLAEDFGKSHSEIETLLKAASDDSPI